MLSPTTNQKNVAKKVQLLHESSYHLTTKLCLHSKMNLKRHYHACFATFALERGWPSPDLLSWRSTRMRCYHSFVAIKSGLAGGSNTFSAPPLGFWFLYFTAASLVYLEIASTPWQLRYNTAVSPSTKRLRPVSKRVPHYDRSTRWCAFFGTATV